MKTKRLSQDDWKEKHELICRERQRGLKLDQACEAVGVNRKSYDNACWRFDMKYNGAKAKTSTYKDTGHFVQLSEKDDCARVVLANGVRIECPNLETLKWVLTEVVK